VASKGNGQRREKEERAVEEGRRGKEEGLRGDFHLLTPTLLKKRGRDPLKRKLQKKRGDKSTIFSGRGKYEDEKTGKFLKGSDSAAQTWKERMIEFGEGSFGNKGEKMIKQGEGKGWVEVE